MDVVFPAELRLKRNIVWTFEFQRIIPFFLGDVSDFYLSVLWILFCLCQLNFSQLHNFFNLHIINSMNINILLFAFSEELSNFIGALAVSKRITIWWDLFLFFRMCFFIYHFNQTKFIFLYCSKFWMINWSWRWIFTVVFKSYIFICSYNCIETLSLWWFCLYNILIVFKLCTNFFFFIFLFLCIWIVWKITCYRFVHTFWCLF